MSVEAALGVGEAIGSTRVTSLEGGFREERLEMLQAEVQQLRLRLRDAEDGVDVALRDAETARVQHEQQLRRASEQHQQDLVVAERQSAGSGTVRTLSAAAQCRPDIHSPTQDCVFVRSTTILAC